MTPELVHVNSELAEPRVKLLIVDDHSDSVAALSAILEVLGEDVLTATSADTALMQLLKHDVAVIVLDVVMPGTDGFQLAGMIRERARYRCTPIIFLTGLGQEPSFQLEGYRSGAVDFLIKPCNPDVLRSKVKVFVDLAKTTAMLQRYAVEVENKNRELHSNTHKLQEALTRTLHMNAMLEREIQQRKRAEATRDRLAGQLGATPGFVEAMAEGAVTLALDQTILYCNSRFAAMVGRKPEEVMGRQIGGFIEANAVLVFDSLFKEARQDSVKAEFHLIGASGERVPAQVALSVFRTPDFEAAAMVVTDLRDHKRIEEVLAQGRLSQQIVENSLCGIAVCDVNGRITLANSELAAICGTDPLFKPFGEVFPLKLADESSFSPTQVTLTCTVRSTEVVFNRHDGRVFALLVSASPLNTLEDYAGCVITMMDISERKQVEEALRRSEKLAAAGRIAAALAHEVNNPLTSVLNLVYLAQTNKSLDEVGRQYLETASGELNRVSNIVRRTLAFYRESNSPVRFDARDMIESVLELYASDIARKNVNLLKDYDWSDNVLGFPGEMRQVVSNLLANAIDAVPEGGRIRIRVHSSRKWRSGTAGICIVIGDTGTGMSREQVQRLGEPFFTTKGEKGTGLGLWVTQGIIHKHNGLLRVHSSTREARRGTVVSVFLPMAQDASDAAPDTRGAQRAA